MKSTSAEWVADMFYKFSVKMTNVFITHDTVAREKILIFWVLRILEKFIIHIWPILKPVKLVERTKLFSELHVPIV